jgi:uncharacterized protein (DUF1330 family)
MPTYFVVNATVTDPELLASYRAATTATFEGHDVTVLVSTNDAETIEGEPAGSRVVVLKFPDADAFRAWYDSPAYQAIIGMRTASTEGFAVLAEGRE